MPDRALVTAAVAASSHMTEFLTKMGEPLDPPNRKRWRDRLKRWQVDTTHWTHSHKRLYSAEDLARAVAVGRWIARLHRPKSRVCRPRHGSLLGAGASTRKASPPTTAAGTGSSRSCPRLQSHSGQSPAACPYRDGRRRVLRTMWRRPRMAGESIALGHRSPQRRVSRQPVGKPSVPLPELPCSDAHLVPADVCSVCMR